MERNIVPVVLGGADYAAIAPPHSYINALDYTPHELATYLTELDRNATFLVEAALPRPQSLRNQQRGVLRFVRSTSHELSYTKDSQRIEKVVH